MTLCGEAWGNCSLAGQPAHLQAGDFETFYEGMRDTEHYHWNRGEYDSRYRPKYEAKHRR